MEEVNIRKRRILLWIAKTVRPRGAAIALRLVGHSCGYYLLIDSAHLGFFDLFEVETEMGCHQLFVDVIR